MYIPKVNGRPCRRQSKYRAMQRGGPRKAGIFLFFNQHHKAAGEEGGEERKGREPPPPLNFVDKQLGVSDQNTDSTFQTTFRKIVALDCGHRED